MKRFFKTFIIAFLCFSVFFSGILFFALKSNGSDFVSSDLSGDSKKNESDDKEITFLLMGIDTKDLSTNEHQRTDTMMLCRYDDTTGKLSVLSIPRDTRANIRGRKNKEKINHAHAYGGPELAVKTVRDLLGIDLEYYVRVDYKIVEEFVDIIGGVEVDVPMNMVYSDPTADPPLYINLKKGQQVLTGEQSLQFLRYRKGYADQDLGRINAQQQFVKSAIKQTMKPSNILKIPKLINTYFGNVDTNIPKSIVSKYALKAAKFDTENIEMATLPGKAKQINGLWYFIPDSEQSQQLVDNMFIEHNVVKNNENQ